MSETFNFKRFLSFFRFDLRRLWQRHAKAAMLIGGAGLLLYMTVGIFSLLITFEWTSSIMGARLFYFFIAFAVLELYTTQTYGHITKRKEGPDYLMMPASNLEKYISMMVNTLIVIPVLFVVTYFTLDALLCLVDPGCGQPLAIGIRDFWFNFVEDIYDYNAHLGLRQIPVQYSPASFVLLFGGSLCFNFLFYLFAGLLFRRLKILFAILSSWGLSMVASLAMTLAIPFMVDKLEDLDEAGAAIFSDSIMTATTLTMIVLSLGLAWLCWIRLKKICH